jgi:hypothetical protein
MIVQLQARARRVPRGVRVSLCLRVRCQLSWAVAGSSKLHPRSMLPRPTRPVPVPVGRSRPRPAPQAPAAGRARRGGSAVSFHLSLPTRVATVRIDEAEGRAATAVARGSRTLAAGGRRARAGRWGDLTQCEPRHSGDHLAFWYTRYGQPASTFIFSFILHSLSDAQSLVSLSTVGIFGANDSTLDSSRVVFRRGFRR